MSFEQRQILLGGLPPSMTVWVRPRAICTYIALSEDPRILLTTCHHIEAMFTGLIEHLGTVSSIDLDSNGCTLTVSNSSFILDDCKIGDSIAVNGACLTVIEFDEKDQGGWFKVWLANETLQRTDLGERKVGDQLNLERAMSSHTRVGGHFVQGHVDATATICSKTADGDSLRLVFQLQASESAHSSLMTYIVPKGYVAIDGTSLTITFVDDSNHQFGVMLIKHTQDRITLGKKSIGEKVNIEVDMVGKYVEKSVAAALGGQESGITALVEKIVSSVLAKKGIK